MEYSSPIDWKCSDFMLCWLQQMGKQARWCLPLDYFVRWWSLSWISWISLVFFLEEFNGYCMERMEWKGNHVTLYWDDSPHPFIMIQWVYTDVQFGNSRCPAYIRYNIQDMYTEIPAKLNCEFGGSSCSGIYDIYWLLKINLHLSLLDNNWVLHFFNLIFWISVIILVHFVGPTNLTC